MKVPKALREWVENTSDHAITEFSIKFMYADPQKAYNVFTSAIINSMLKENTKRVVLKNLSNDLSDLLVDEDDTLSSSTWTSSPKYAGKRADTQIPDSSCKKRGGITMAMEEYVSDEEGQDKNEAIDEHGGSSGETIMDGLKVNKSVGASINEGTVMFDASGDNRKYMVPLRPLVTQDKALIGSGQITDLKNSAKRTKRRKTEKVKQTAKNAIQETKATKDVEEEALASPTQTNEGESSTLSSLLYSRAKRDHGRRSSVSGQEYVEVKEFRISPNEFDIVYYTVGATNVGQAFKKYQVASLSIVNKIGTMATVSNFSSFLSMNFIWDLAVTLPNLDKVDYQLIQDQYTWSRSVLPEAVVELCRELDEQLANGQDIEAEIEKDLRSERLLYEVLALKLPLEFLPFERGLEDTYCHGVIDALLTRQFPARSKYHLDWANKEAWGSKERRINGYKPDGIIKDLWKLANYCKDAIDSNLHQGLQIRKAAAVQVFGHRMALYTMAYDHGIYHWSKSCIAYLPCDQTDTGRILPCLRLLATLDDFLESIHIDIGPCTPPLFDYEDVDERPIQDTGRISKVTPTERPMF
ncbi:hypothetical protein BGZ95_000382 [Linnemannia exigua]|uniref:Uncharacterized protein n=1 Tax=Linnemannia exigua TaxID=604196 RepID=A0AAD4H4D9_9FUNG|nr:hypothetical protein BGZ95_000382 [Linnemannia exigua]